MMRGTTGPTRWKPRTGHRRHLLALRRPHHPDARAAQAQGGARRDGHRAEGAEEAGRRTPGLMRIVLFTGKGGVGTVDPGRGGRRPLRAGRTAHAAAVPAGRRRCRGWTTSRAWTSSAWTRRRRSSGSGRRPAGAVGAVVPQLTLPPESSVVPLPGHRRPRAVRRARARRGRPRRAGRRAAGVDVRAGGAARRRCAGGSTSCCRRGCGRWAPSGPPPSRAGAAKRGPVDAALAAVPVVEELLARDRLTGAHHRLPGRRAAAHDRRRAARTAVTDARAARPAPPARVLARVLPAGRRGGVGDPPRRRAGRRRWPALAEVAPVHRVPEHAVPPDDVGALAGLLQDFEPAVSAPRPRRQTPSARTARGS